MEKNKAICFEIYYSINSIVIHGMQHVNGQVSFYFID